MSSLTCTLVCQVWQQRNTTHVQSLERRLHTETTAQHQLSCVATERSPLLVPLDTEAQSPAMRCLAAQRTFLRDLDHLANALQVAQSHNREEDPVTNVMQHRRPLLG